jgi:hypothetical protein
MTMATINSISKELSAPGAYCTIDGQRCFVKHDSLPTYKKLVPAVYIQGLVDAGKLVQGVAGKWRLTEFHASITK